MVTTLETPEKLFSVLRIVLDTGERLPCLVNSQTWIPVRVATRWAVRHRRLRTQSSKDLAEEECIRHDPVDFHAMSGTLRWSPRWCINSPFHLFPYCNESVSFSRGPWRYRCRFI